MALKLMYITNKPNIATIAQESGVDRIFVDLESIGKEERQKGMNTVKSYHTVADVENIRRAIDHAELLVRVNPFDSTKRTSKQKQREVDDVISAGADIVMLPMFSKREEVEEFVFAVGGRAKTTLLVETKKAVENIEEIINIEGIDEIHIGLNDLHLSYNKKFMFELLTDGTVEKLCGIFKSKGIPYGFGGIARLGYGQLLAEKVIIEHYRLGSTRAILSRSFCNLNEIIDNEQIREVFVKEMQKIRLFEQDVSSFSDKQFVKNSDEVATIVNLIVNGTK